MPTGSRGLSATGRCRGNSRAKTRPARRRKARCRGDSALGLRRPTPSTSICPYCAVGCAQLVYAKDGQVIHIEGDPRSPINQGTLCPKGAATFGWLTSPDRLTKVLYRAPHAESWEERPLGWAMDRIAYLVKRTRDETFVRDLPDGTPVNHTLAIGSLGGATLDNEENYLIKKLFGAGLGMGWIENQARV